MGKKEKMPEFSVKLLFYEMQNVEISLPVCFYTRAKA